MENTYKPLTFLFPDLKFHIILLSYICVTIEYF